LTRRKVKKVDKKFPAFYANRRFITAFTKARSCTYPEPHESNPLLSTFFPKYIFQYHSLSTPMSSEWTLPSRFFYQNILCISHLSYACYIPCGSHSPNLITLIIFDESKIYGTSHHVVFSSLPPLSPPYIQIFSSAPFSNTLNLCSSLTIRAEFSRPYKREVNLRVYTF